MYALVAAPQRNFARPLSAIYVATLSFAEILLRLVAEHVADDVSEIKDSFIRRKKAEADGAEADAMKRLAEAAEAANKANLPKRKDRLAQLEVQRRQLANAKTAAEIDVLRAESEARRLQATAEAKARLIEALSKVKQEGGTVFFDKENLKQILEGPSKSALGDVEHFKQKGQLGTPSEFQDPPPAPPSAI